MPGVKLVILDRDGVINQDSADFIKSPDEWLPIKGSLEAIARLSQAGVDVVVLTNQSGVGRGLLTANTLGRIHVRMVDYVQQFGGKIQSILFCPHHPDEQCNCRKPKTGLYEELANRLNLSFDDVYSVGDSLRDLQAAQSAGAKPVLVKTGNGRQTLKQITQDEDTHFEDLLVFDNLAGFVDALLAGQLAHD
ncbi:D-glycero-beta-D-manno-heptose-1,7-bisphosphate 7-phosphatase [Arenicella chitinivorans]|uniref:D,D-heptose 1,7-bisphosphate phosphatase n=1 Tax=Arenicella chitinivorans TaxID=1329800 RepID=A0A918VNQ1_9GAMM|nr:D-glycero-beta-D-manno-heptose 1,7-bisphosphate 7-phosphatase [Arenicella chitinivorans]GHA11025.1 D-glycero-beta-D-manno-heptose-1,7-bisphosphate 7-phosphatase [Arenicella chitinivorans]